ncbi:MAG: SH3 domain-containing protein, partial [Fibrobacterota bacterium]
MKKYLFIPLVLVFAFALSAQENAVKPGTLKVLANGNIRKEASKTGAVVEGAKKDAVIYYTELKDGWYKITDENGKEKGWVTKGVVSELTQPSKAEAVAETPAAEPAPESAPASTPMTGKKIKLTSNGKLRKTGAATGEAIRVVPKDTVMAVSELAGDWYHVVDKGGADMGWVSKTVAEEYSDELPPEAASEPAPEPAPAAAPATPKKIKLISNGKLRKTASSSGEAIRVVPKDTVMLVTELKGDWYKVVDDIGAEKGWVSKTVAEDFVEAAVPAAAPLVVADTTKPAVDSTAIKAAADSALKAAAAPPEPPKPVEPAIESEPMGKKSCRTFDDVNSVLSAGIGTVMDAYARLQKTDKTLKGKLTVSFVIM